MHIIWLVEAVKQDFSITHGLLGNFATRVFSSAASFVKISTYEKLHPPSIIILDLELANFDTQNSVIKHVNTNFSKTPFMVINSSPMPPGCQYNFLQKPIDLFYLIKSIREILKDEGMKSENISCEDLVFYPTTQEIEFESASGFERVKLSRQESLILKSLMKNFGKTVSRQTILLDAWDSAKVSDRTMDSHISRLRSALSVSARIQLLNVYGKGFTLTQSL